MKVLDVHPLKDGLHRNITMLDRLGNEMETIDRAVQGLVAMEDSLKGEGGNAIRAFYSDCHSPFLQFFKLFQSRFTYVLKQMDAALDGLEPDSSGFIREHFLDVEIEQGLKTIAQLTESLTDEANSIMNQVADIVALPHLNDSEVQEGVHTATIKRNTTLTQLYEFDANQTTALMPIARDLMTMETWISDIEGLFTDGVTAINFSANQWATLSSKNTLKTDLAQHTAAKAGLPVMMGVNGHPTTMLGALLAGEDRIEFSYGFVDAPNLLYELGILSFSDMATYGRPIATVSGDIITNEEQVNGFITEGEELSPEEVAQLINYLKKTDFDDPNRKSGIQTLPPYDGEITFEGMRKVVGGNGPGTPDGLAPYAMGAFDFFSEDIGTMLSADATEKERFEAAVFTFIKPAKMYDTAHDALKTGEKAKDAGKSIDNPLLPGEGKVGTYEELIDEGTRGDNITPHHMPSAKYMKTKAEVHKNDGVSMNMEQPHPGKGGRHRQTETYGITGKKLEDYLILEPRDALARDIIDAKNIYIKEGLYTPEIRSGLLEIINLNKTKYPNIFER